MGGRHPLQAKTCSALHAVQVVLLAEMPSLVNSNRFEGAHIHRCIIDLPRKCPYHTRRSTAPRVFRETACKGSSKTFYGAAILSSRTLHYNAFEIISRDDVTARGRSLQLKASSDGLSSPEESMQPVRSQVPESTSPKQR